MKNVFNQMSRNIHNFGQNYFSRRENRSELIACHLAKDKKAMAKKTAFEK